MDRFTERFVLDLLNTIKHNKTVLVISHRDSLTSISDRVYALGEGKMGGILSPSLNFSGME